MNMGADQVQLGLLGSVESPGSCSGTAYTAGPISHWAAVEYGGGQVQLGLWGSVESPGSCGNSQGSGRAARCWHGQGKKLAKSPPLRWLPLQPTTQRIASPTHCTPLLHLGDDKAGACLQAHADAALLHKGEGQPLGKVQLAAARGGSREGNQSPPALLVTNFPSMHASWLRSRPNSPLMGIVNTRCMLAGRNGCKASGT